MSHLQCSRVEDIIHAITLPRYASNGRSTTKIGTDSQRFGAVTGFKTTQQKTTQRSSIFKHLGKIFKRLQGFLSILGISGGAHLSLHVCDFLQAVHFRPHCLDLCADAFLLRL